MFLHAYLIECINELLTNKVLSSRTRAETGGNALGKCRLCLSDTILPTGLSWVVRPAINSLRQNFGSSAANEKRTIGARAFPITDG